MPLVRLEQLNENNLDIESCCCLTYDQELKKDAETKKKWLRTMMRRGLRGLLLFEDDAPAGFIEYQPISLAPCPATGENLYFINCLMVHIWDLGPGSMQGKGYGRLLVEAAEKDVMENTDAKGIVAWGLDHEFWFMPHTFFQHLGYKVVDSDGPRMLLVKKFAAVPDPSLRPVTFEPELEAGKAAVDFFYSNQCPYRLYQLRRWRKVAEEFDDEVVFREYKTDKKPVMDEFGIKSGLFVNGEEVFAGPMTEEEIRDKISAAINKLDDDFGWGE
ncbi:MAG: GNAT family N-acetyltransferase [Candidatus Coatesbacteria bacterium]|nr:GNAT family N-acetyltransferase [Candidatus Coatesbacteria bacterium]